MLEERWRLYRVIFHAGGAIDVWRRPLVQLGSAMLLAEAIHRLVERPFIALGRIATDPVRRSTFAPQRSAKVGLASAGFLIVLFWSRHALLAALGPMNRARGATVTMSSHRDGKPDGGAVTDGIVESVEVAETTEEESPWITLDLGRSVPIGSIRVYSRVDGARRDQLPLVVQLSEDGQSFRQIGRRDEMFTSELPWNVPMKESPTRYIRLTVPRKASLGLAEVEVFQPTWIGSVP
jgi:hypothetical protein